MERGGVADSLGIAPAEFQGSVEEQSEDVQYNDWACLL